MMIGGIAGIIAYFWLVFLSPWKLLTVKATAMVAAAIVMVIVSYIGYSMATIPPPEPLSSITEGLDEDLFKKEGEAEED
jgi:predicted DNA-binding transcriptional regulator